MHICIYTTICDCNGTDLFELHMEHNVCVTYTIAHTQCTCMSYCVYNTYIVYVLHIHVCAIVYVTHMAHAILHTTYVILHMTQAIFNITCVMRVCNM